jgi:hypothetical protein
MAARIDHEGQRFGKLKVIGFSHTVTKGKSTHAYWQCVCDCGEQSLPQICGEGNSYV